MGSDRRGHVVLFTFPVPGHFHPFVQLLYALNANCPGLIVTMTVGSQFAEKLTALKSNGDFGNIDLRLEQVPGENPPFPTDRKFPARAALSCEKQVTETEPLRKRLKAQMSTPEAPTAVICDMFLAFTKTFADDLGVPWYTYFSGNPMWTLVILEHAKLVKAGLDSRNISKETDDFLLAKIPDFPKPNTFTSVRTTDIPHEIYEFIDFYTETATRAREGAGVLQNSAEELDVSSGVIPALKQLVGPSKYLCIGPFLQIPGFGKVYSPTDLGTAGSWLDSQQKNSVLYVAFGSLGSIPTESILELAKGLEASGVPFLWALKTGNGKLSDVLPEGFEERMKGRGHIETGWVAQTTILQHQAVGGFLTHCGWNSVMEGICSGVPLIAWPLAADQLMGGRYVHEVTKVGMTIAYSKDEYKYDYDDITAKEVSQTVRSLMLEDEGRQRRANIEALQKLAAAAVVKGGSSKQHLQDLFSRIYSPPTEEPVEIAEALQ